MIVDLLKIGNDKLRAVNEWVPKKFIRSEECKKLVKDMLDTMKNAGGVGIAAPQIGVNRKISIITINNETEVMINPVVVPLTDKKQGFWEGCLSYLLHRTCHIQSDFFYLQTALPA